MLANRSLGALAAGLHTVPLAPEDLSGAGGGRDLVLKLSAVSSYANGPSDAAQARFQLSGTGDVALPSRPVLLGSTPNPMTTSTRIAMVLPASGAARATLGMYDASGRRVRAWSGFSPGLNEVEWDGTDDHGHAARAGVYFYRLELLGMRETGRIALVR